MADAAMPTGKGRAHNGSPYVNESLARGLVRQFSRNETDQFAKGKSFLDYVRRSGNLLRTRRRPPRPFFPQGTDVDYFSVTDPYGSPNLLVSTAHLNKRGELLIPLPRIWLLISFHACQRVLQRKQVMTAEELKSEFEHLALAVIDMGDARLQSLATTWLITPHGAGPALLERLTERFAGKIDVPTEIDFQYLVLKTWMSDENLKDSSLGLKRLERINAARRADHSTVDLSTLF